MVTILVNYIKVVNTYNILSQLLSTSLSHKFEYYYFSQNQEKGYSKVMKTHKNHFRVAKLRKKKPHENRMKDDYYYLNFKEQEGMDVSWAFSGIPTEVRQESCCLCHQVSCETSISFMRTLCGT